MFETLGEGSEDIFANSDHVVIHVVFNRKKSVKAVCIEMLINIA